MSRPQVPWSSLRVGQVCAFCPFGFTSLELKWRGQIRSLGEKCRSGITGGCAYSFLENCTMNNQLIEIVLPRLARPLYHQLQQYQSGQMDDDQFTRRFEPLLRRQHVSLAKLGVPSARAWVSIPGAVHAPRAP